MQNMNRGRCAVCGEDEIQFYPLDVNEWSPSIMDGLENDQYLDLGFGEHALQINNLMLSYVSMCRHCGYCAADIFASTKTRRLDVEDTQYRAQLYRNCTTLNSMHNAAYRLGYQRGDIFSTVYHLIIMEWANRNDRSFPIINPHEIEFIVDNMGMLTNGILLSLVDVFRKRHGVVPAERLLCELKNRCLSDREAAIVSYQEVLLKKHQDGDQYVAQAFEFAEGCNHNIGGSDNICE